LSQNNLNFIEFGDEVPTCDKDKDIDCYVNNNEIDHNNFNGKFGKININKNKSIDDYKKINQCNDINSSNLKIIKERVKSISNDRL
jgi:hypothetical protein